MTMNINSFSWYKNIDDSDLEYVEESLKLDFAIAIEKAMTDRQVGRSELATRINTSPAYITKVLRGDANVTIATMAKLSHALNYCVHFYLARKDSKVQWFEVITGGQASKNVSKEKMEKEKEKEVSALWAEFTNTNKKVPTTNVYS